MAEITQSTVVQLLNDAHVAAKVRWENFLLVGLGLRPQALIVIPTQFADGRQLNTLVEDLSTRRFMYGLDPTRVRAFDRWLSRKYHQYLQWTRPINRYRTQLIEESLEAVLRASRSYATHREWAARLGLYTYELPLHHKLREWYLFRDPARQEKLQALGLLREEIRRRPAPTTTLSTHRIDLFPEERNAQFITMMGELLGYPTCCVRRYAEERAEGTLVEQRAADQIKALVAEGRAPSGHAYYVQDFVPCSPVCPEAEALGHRAEEALDQVDLRAAQGYMAGVQDNMQRVATMADLIEARKAELAARMQAAELER